MITDPRATPEMKQALLRAGLFEAMCVVAGFILFFATGHWIWILTGILAGAGFSIPAIIRHFRALKEQTHASR